MHKAETNKTKIDLSGENLQGLPRIDTNLEILIADNNFDHISYKSATNTKVLIIGQKQNRVFRQSRAANPLSSELKPKFKSINIFRRDFVMYIFTRIKTSKQLCWRRPDKFDRKPERFEGDGRFS
jgi:hypothetical protein